jgi:hypothetical protein
MLLGRPLDLLPSQHRCVSTSSSSISSFSATQFLDQHHVPDQNQKLTCSNCPMHWMTCSNCPMHWFKNMIKNQKLKIERYCPFLSMSLVIQRYCPMHWMTWLKTTTKSIGPLTLVITLHILRSLATLSFYSQELVGWIIVLQTENWTKG